jgi:Cysteine-rich secretory protein family
MRLPLLLLLFLAASANAQNVAEQYLLRQTNQHRAEHHLAPLAWDPALARAARAHALRIVQEVNRRPGPAEHQYPGEPALLARASEAGAHFSTISENVAGNGQSAAEFDVAWMNSPAHRGNILDPRLTAIGIAVVQSRGLLYAVQDFARNVPDLTPGNAQALAEQALLSHGIRLEPSAQARQDARHACTSQSAIAPSEPALLMQWEGPDLNQLPATILPQLHAGRSRTVAIAACPSTRPSQGFTTYHIAILIY